MQALKGFMEFIGESRRFMQLGLLGLDDEQEDFLDRCTYGSWEFDPETGLVNIQGEFNCLFKQLTDFKGIRFGQVSGDFSCSGNKLTSLLGAPQQVGGDFDCSVNQLTSLLGAPAYVDGDFWCHDNLLTSLEGAPKKVGGWFVCDRNPDLQSLADLPKLSKVEVPKHLEERLELMREEAKKLKSEE